MQINGPGTIKPALPHKEIVQLGPATNVWNSVRIDDLCNFNTLLFDHAMSGTTRVQTRFYVASGEEYAWAEVAKESAKLLYAIGAIESATPKAVNLQDGPDLIIVVSDARAVLNRGPSTFGWNIHGASLWETLPKEVVYHRRDKTKT